MIPIVVTLALRTKNPLNSREHWRTVSKRGNIEKFVTSLVMAKHLAGVSPVGLTVTFVRLSTRALDCDGLPGCLKHVRDAIAKLLGVDDGPTGPITWRYEQRKCKRGEWGVEVSVDGP